MVCFNGTSVCGRLSAIICIAKFCKKIREIRSEDGTEQEIAEKIVAKGGTSWGAVILGFAVYSAIVVFGIFGVTKIFA